jgi:uncharacterized protein (DUF885 family)
MKTDFLQIQIRLGAWVIGWLMIVCAKHSARAQETVVSNTTLSALVRLYDADRQSVNRYYELPWSIARQDRVENLLRDWSDKLRQVSFPSLGQYSRVDYLLFRNELTAELAKLNLERNRRREMEQLLPFMPAIHSLEVARWHMEKLDPAKAAALIDEIPSMIRKVRKEIESGRKKAPRSGTPAKSQDGSSSIDPESSESTNRTNGLAVSAALARRTAAAVAEIRGSLKSWAAFYEGSVPEFSWWMKKPNEAALSALDDYAKFLREEIAGLKGKEEDPLVGDPIGATSLAADIAAEWLAYSPEELLAIGERELAWCESEMKKAAAEMGLGNDWKSALARVKAGHVPPGQQDQLVTDEARYAIDFVKSRQLVTIPPLCEELWRTSMLTTDAQKTLPYAAYNGPNILVAYARDDMKHEDKLMSMRGNNRYFTRLVTFHELIPGHHLEAFMTARYSEHRRTFRTPFFVEGWALYWEIVFWNLGYARSPEERIGMLFWRMHRCARIVVSLKFHLGQMTPAQMVDFLVDRVGHERLGATSEVRRFIGGSYSPLYQCAYMIGGLQLKALHDELVPGRMSDLQFNDAVLRLGAIPIELVRASLNSQALRPDSTPAWRALIEPVDRP